MKKIIAMFAACTVLMFGMSVAMAEKAAATTVKGTMKCAKCSLKEADKCAAVVVAADGAKYVIAGPAAGPAHKEICQKDKEGVSVTGVVSEKDGKKIITAEKVD